MGNPDYIDEDEDTTPVGFLGRLRNAKLITWVLIIGLVALSFGATSLVVILGSAR